MERPHHLHIVPVRLVQERTILSFAGHALLVDPVLMVEHSKNVLAGLEVEEVDDGELVQDEEGVLLAVEVLADLADVPGVVHEFLEHVAAARSDLPQGVLAAVLCQPQYVVHDVLLREVDLRDLLDPGLGWAGGTRV